MITYFLAVGSGKTLAYSIPLVQNLLQYQEGEGEGDATGVLGLILVPTRELCTQVRTTLESLLFYCDDLSVASISGQQSIEVQVKHCGSSTRHYIVMVVL